MAVGLLGAGGQMVLFYAVARGPAYLIFPIVSLSPVVTIGLSVRADRRTHRQARPARHRAGAAGAAHFRFRAGRRRRGAAATGWLLPALLVMLFWGVQAYFMKSANLVMSAESIFFYMTVGGLLIVPVAFAMTDFHQPIDRGLGGAGLAAVIQVLNAIGALTLVFAFRYGKAIIVSHRWPMRARR